MINREILSEVLKQKAFEKQVAEDFSQKNYEKALKNQDFFNFELEKRKKVFEIGICKFEKKDTAELEKQLEDIIKKQNDVLEIIGFKPDDLKPNYSCKECNDTGYVNGKLCKCVSQKYYHSLMKKSSIDFSDVENLDEYKTDCFEDKTEIENRMKQYMETRKQSQPLEVPNAGSTFKRGEDFITSKIIDECGLKGTHVGDAEVSTKHAGFIINKGNATASDIIELIEQVKNKVLEEKGKELKLEIKIIGE